MPAKLNHLLEKVVSVIAGSDKKGSKVLDLGCGDGEQAKNFWTRDLRSMPATWMLKGLSLRMSFPLRRAI